MTYYDAYVGRLDDPDFLWDGGDWSGNVPHRLSPFFPSTREPVFWEVLRRIERGDYEGKQTDWGGWVAKVTKQQLLEFMTDIYGAPEQTTLNNAAHPLHELQQFIERLEDGGQYALVATEL
jgi:hypothetical protein